MLSRHGLQAFARRINDRVFYGWIMLAVAAVGMFASGPGQSHTFSVFITPISQDLGISRTAISSAYAAATLVAAFGLPYVGRLIDRFGVRLVLLVVVTLFSAATIAFGQVTNLVALTLGFGALRFLGQGSLMLSSTNLVAQWFSRKRGFAMSLMGLGFAATMAAHPPLAQWLIDQVGWREAWLWLGLLSLALMLPLVVFLIQNKPEDVGLVPDGATDAGAASGWGASGLVQSANLGLSVGQALRTPAFWIIAVSLGTLSMLVTALFFHQVSIFQSQQLTAQVAAAIFPVSAITMVLSMPFIGRALDAFPTQPVFASAMLTMSVSMIALVFVSDIVSALVYAVIFGIANAVIHTHIGYLWPRFFGRRYLGSIQGAGQTIGVVGASIGPIPFGITYDVLGSYTLALVTFAALPVLCSLAILSMRPPRLEEHPAPAQA